MGYKIAGEVLDRCPDLPYRQFRVLMALALDARDSTRQAMPGHELLALRGNCSMRTIRRIVDQLAARGLVKADGHPAPGRRAVYTILPMPGSPANEVAGDTPDNEVAGDHRRTPANEVASEHRPSARRTPANVVATPKSYTSVKDLTAATPPPTAQAILAAFIDWDRASGGQLTKRTRGQLAKHIAGLLAEGVPEDAIKRGLADWRSAPTAPHPSTVHSFVDAAMRGANAHVSRRDSEQRAKHARWMEWARRADAAERGEPT